MFQKTQLLVSYILAHLFFFFELRKLKRCPFRNSLQMKLHERKEQAIKDVKLKISSVIETIRYHRTICQTN